MGQPVVHFEVVGKDGDKLRTRVMGPQKMDNPPIEIGLFTDPEVHVIGVVK
jgi:hypothetical protein